MAISQLPQAPYRQDRRIYPTPDSGDVLFSEVRDCTRSEIPEYGTPHPNPKKWPDHKLVFVKTVDIERDGIFEFFYAADRENQDLYNFSVGYRNIIGNVGGREFRVVQRSYITPRADFQPLDIPFGTPMPNVPEGKFDDVEYVFFDRQQQPIDQQELNSLYVAEVHTYVEKAFLDDKLSYTAQRNDPLPEKFQILVPEQVVEQIVGGTAEMPTLTGSNLSIKEDQLNPDVKLVRTASRDRSTLPVSLGQKATTNEKQLASIIQTVQSGDTLEQPSATVDIQSEALGDGTYVVTKTEVPELFTSESYSTEKPDLVPPKFRSVIPTTTEELNEIGQAEPPILIDQGDLAISEQQVNEFVKRTRKTKRDLASLPQSLTQKTTSNDKQTATVTETYQLGDTSESASATVDIESEAIGDGTYVVRKIEVPELFTSESYSTEKPDLVPPKFRAVVPTTTEEFNSIGEASEPELDVGDLAITEQQQNKFVKRTRITKRDLGSLPETISQKSTTNAKQLATITETLQVGDTSEQPSATQEIESEALGDGTYVVRKTQVPDVFNEKAYSVEKPDTVPERFRAQVPTTSESTTLAGQATQPSLLTDELSKSKQQVNKFVYREQVVKRAITADVTLPQVQKAYVDGTIGKVDEKLSTNPSIESGLLVSESSATSIGDGKFIVQTVKVDNWPELKSSDWDPVLNAQVVRTEQFVAPPTTFTEENTSFRAINKDRALKVVEDAPVTALNSYVMSFPIQVDLQLPNVLKRLEVVWAQSYSEGSFDSEFEGSNISISGSESGSATSSVSIKPELIVDIEQPWGSDITATAYYFFMQSSNNSVSEAAFLSRLSVIAGGAVSRWPSFKPVSHTILLQGVSGAVKANVSASASANSTGYDKTEGKGTEYDLNILHNAVIIPPTIHGQINILNAETRTQTIQAYANVGWFVTQGNFPVVDVTSYANKNVEAKVTPTSLSPTTPVGIPTSGLYVTKSSIDPYKWGWVKCGAYVINASVLA